MKPEIKCRRAVVNLNLQEIQALNDYRIAYGRRGFKCARSAMEKVIEAWKVAGAENATTTKKSLAVGNAAKLREALSALIPVAEHGLSARTHSLNCTVGATNVEAARALVEQAKEAITNAHAALAEPPRNCERFKTKEEAATAFANEKKQWIPQQVLWELAPWLDWLFVTMEKKGGEA